MIVTFPEMPDHNRKRLRVPACMLGSVVGCNPLKHIDISRAALRAEPAGQQPMGHRNRGAKTSLSAPKASMPLVGHADANGMPC
jgi:hypothetical protein